MRPANRMPSAVERLHSIRVLLVARDRRFLRVAGMLLAQRGCAVEATERPSELLERVRSQRTNVVVLDGSDSLAATARSIAALEALPWPVSVIVVYEGDEAAGPMRSLRLLPKWGAFDRLVGAVERVYESSAG